MPVGVRNNYSLKSTLYKAISSSAGDWICGYVIETIDGVSIAGIGHKQIIECEQVIPDTVCQVTPLRTIKDEAIYEFDIVLYDNDEYYLLCCSFPCWYYMHLIEVEDEKRFKIDDDASKHMVPNPYAESRVKKIVGNFKDLIYPYQKGFRKSNSNSSSNNYIS